MAAEPKLVQKALACTSYKISREESNYSGKSRKPAFVPAPVAVETEGTGLRNRIQKVHQGTYITKKRPAQPILVPLRKSK